MSQFSVNTKREIQNARNLGREIYSNLKKPFFDKIESGQFYFKPVTNTTNAKLYVIKVYNGKDNKVWDKVIKRGSLKDRKSSNWNKPTELNVPVQVKNTGTKREVVVRFVATGRDHSGGEENSDSGKKVSATEKTVMQETASLLFIQKALNGGGVGKVFRNWAGEGPDCVTADKKFYKKLKEVYPMIDDNTDWQHSFMAQGRKMLTVAAAAGWSEMEFDRDSPNGFMKFIEKLIVNKFKISKPDAWNPADIWMIKDEKVVRGKIEKALENIHPTSAFDQIGILNEIMKAEFIAGRIIGVSLKLVTKPKQGAMWKVYNVSHPAFARHTQKRDYVVSLGPVGGQLKSNIFLALNFNTDGKPPFATQELKFWLYNGSKKSYEYVVKGVSSVKAPCNLKFEPKDVARSKAFMGKSPVPQVRKLMIDYGIGGDKTDRLKGFDNNHTSYPKDLNSFLNAPKKEGTNIYAYMWTKIKNKVTTNINSEEEFMNNMTLQFASMAPFAQQKLMELNFIYVILEKLTKAKRNQMLTDMLAYAEKFGDIYGPFGKLY
ncbi:MAG: hypothetical protein H8D80_01970 [Proteobacteria bacterium]|nr:hypothetical protein [Pseudomonadota bacterium]